MERLIDRTKALLFAKTVQNREDDLTISSRICKKIECLFLEKVQQVDTESGVYVGTILNITDKIASQLVDRQKYAYHDLEKLRKLPKIGAFCSINYVRGIGSVLEHCNNKNTQ